jgi:hypothetical protein
MQATDEKDKPLIHQVQGNVFVLPSPGGRDLREGDKTD